MIPPAAIQSLQLVLEHAEKERDAAQSALRAAEEAAQRARAQADQLGQYRGEYHQRWTGQFSQSGTGPLVQSYHVFGQRLDQAITQQQRQCGLSDQRVQQARQLLLARETRVAAVRKLIERRLGGLQQQAHRRDQRQTDEAAQRAAWAARAAADHP